MVPTLGYFSPRFIIPVIDVQRLFIALMAGFNLLDAYFTMKWISAGIATEANPMMAYALEKGPEWFVLSKVVLVSGGCFILWRRAGANASRYVTPLFVLYSGVMGLHLMQSVVGL